jgi:hypothetical protein
MVCDSKLDAVARVCHIGDIKEEAAQEGLAHEEHIVRLLNQHVEEVIVLDSDDEVDDVGFVARRVKGARDGRPVPLSLFV